MQSLPEKAGHLALQHACVLVILNRLSNEHKPQADPNTSLCRFNVSWRPYLASDTNSLRRKIFGTHSI